MLSASGEKKGLADGGRAVVCRGSRFMVWGCGKEVVFVVCQPFGGFGRCVDGHGSEFRARRSLYCLQEGRSLRRRRRCVGQMRLDPESIVIEVWAAFKQQLS